jgi:hypothetical protein
LNCTSNNANHHQTTRTLRTDTALSCFSFSFLLDYFSKHWRILYYTLQGKNNTSLAQRNKRLYPGYLFDLANDFLLEKESLDY